MRMKKQFVTPRVVQEVRIQLEKDLLGASVKDDSLATIVGQETERHDTSYFEESDWE